MTQTLGRAASLFIAMTLAACTTPKPPPAADTGAIGPAYRHATVTGTGNDASTWRGFGDPVLENLIAQARAANLDVRIAQQRVRQARAGSTAAASRLLLTVAVTGSVSDQRTGLPTEVKRGLPDTRALRGAIDLNWELDVFGAARAAADAAELDALAADAGVATAQWLVSTEVARQYIVWQGARLRLQQLQALLQAQQDTERLTRSRQADGLASRFDVSRAAGEVQSLAAQRHARRLRMLGVSATLVRRTHGCGESVSLDRKACALQSRRDDRTGRLCFDRRRWQHRMTP